MTLTPRTLALAVAALNAGFVALMVAAGWPEWWKNINYETAPMTWFSSVQLLAIGLACAANALLTHAPLPSSSVEPVRQRRLWTALALAFGFLALDERFQIHERLREGVFKPRGIGTELPGIGPGDFMILLYAIAGVVVARWIWRYLGADRPWFGFALGAAALAVGIDVFSPPGSHDVWFMRREQFVEELIETCAQVGFLAAFGGRALRVFGEGRLVAR